MRKNAPQEKKEILIVEDDDTLGELTKLLLQREGYKVAVQRTGKGALIHAAENSVDLVILDLILPDMDGHEVCRRMQKIAYPWGIPVLILTGSHDAADQMQGFSEGAEGFLTKPCDAAELVKTVKLLLGRELIYL